MKDSSECSRKRLVFLHPVSMAILGGAERWVIDVSTRLQSMGFEVHVLSFKRGTERYVKDNRELSRRHEIVRKSFGVSGVDWFEGGALTPSVPAIRFLERNLSRLGVFVPLNLRRIKAVLKGSESVYLTVGGVYKALYESLLVAALGGRNIVVGLHSRPSAKAARRARFCFRLLSISSVLRCVHTVNSFDEGAISPTLNPVKVIFVPDGVDCCKFNPSKAAKSGEFQILFVGGLSKEKGADMIPKIAEHLVTLGVSPRIVIASVGGPLEQRVKEYATQSRGSIEYRGYVDDEGLGRLYAESSVTILPSVEESFGLVALESQASGTPVVCSNASGFRMTVIDSVTGMRVGRYDPAEFGRAINEVYRLWRYSPEKYELMCKNARRHVESTFCWDRVLKKIIGLL